MAETILIVDDEDSVRRTLEEWLRGSGWGCEVIAVPDAETALQKADAGPIDLAILDWNLGSGSDGLQLLEDLKEFQPELVAILVTGYAHQATPLQALRIGVRDYLDKNQDLTRDNFLNAVRRQLDRILPAKRQREFARRLLAFRQTIEKVLPLIQSAGDLSDALPISEGLHRWLAHVVDRSLASGAVVVACKHDSDDGGHEEAIVFDISGHRRPNTGARFSRTLAAGVVAMREAKVVAAPKADDFVDLLPDEVNRQRIALFPLHIGPGYSAALELFDPPDMPPRGRREVEAACLLGGDLIRMAMAERNAHSLLFRAVEATLAEVDRLPGDRLPPTTDEADGPAPDGVLESIRQGLARSQPSIPPELTLQLSELLRVLALQHGAPALRHVAGYLLSLKALLDAMSGGDGE